MTLLELYDTNDSWRVQKAKGNLIKAISENFFVEKLISNMVMSKWESLLEHDTYAVQRSAAESFSSYVQRIVHRGNQLSKVACMGYLQKFKTSGNYKNRMLFIFMTHRIIKQSTKLFEENFASDYLDLSLDKIANVKILMAKVFQNYQDEISAVSDLEEAEANLQNSGIREIEALYSEIERAKQTTLEIKYDCIYLNFINRPDPALFGYTNRKFDMENPDLLKDKSEDEYLKGNGKTSVASKLAPLKPPKYNGKSQLAPWLQRRPLEGKGKSKDSATGKTKDEFQEFDDLIDQIEAKPTKKKK